jgi:hypothetical protein
MTFIIASVPFQATAENEQCPKPHQKFASCGSACEPSCKEPSPLVCTLQCVQGCVCEKGYLQDGQGNCVSSSECPNTSEAIFFYQFCKLYCSKKKSVRFIQTFQHRQQLNALRRTKNSIDVAQLVRQLAKTENQKRAPCNALLDAFAKRVLLGAITEIAFLKKIVQVSFQK